MNILDQINNDKYAEVTLQKQQVSIKQLMQYKMFDKPVLSFSEYITNKGRSGIIAEHKRKSPSKGIINANVNLEDVIIGYQNAGASAISILTNTKYFGGSSVDLQKAAEIAEVPLLRKDFVVDEYQIYEAKAIGAAAVLLIAASLTAEDIERFTKTAHNIGLEVLCEVHNIDELKKISSDVNVVGVNNRDLKTFTVDLQHSIEVANMIPNGFVKISESGISSPETVNMLKTHGFQGFLMGENFMKEPNPGDALKRFIKELDKAN